MITWPDQVFVLSSRDELEGPAGCDKDNWPRQTWLWAQLEVRHLPPKTSFMIFNEWCNVFSKVLHTERKDRRKFYLFECYNATWALLGYEDNQCPKALALAKLTKGEFPSYF